MSHLTISLLGSFHVTLDGRTIAHFGADTARALLAYLAVHADAPQPRSLLAGLLWPDQSEAVALQALRQALSRLRTALGDHGTGDLVDVTRTFVLTTPQTIQFNPQSDYWLDAAAFEQAVSACHKHVHRRLECCSLCIRRLAEVVEWYQGDFLAGFALSSDLFEQWLVIQRERLHGQALEALHALAVYHERRAEYTWALNYARRQITLEGWCEEAHRQAMRALAAQGQRGAALKQYEACQRVLTQELSAEPEAETIHLYERIRDADPSLVSSSLVSSLPASLTPFVGREQELAQIEACLQEPACRLLTLAGLGGIGKTRLALEATNSQAWTFDHGAFWVSLAGVQTVEFIVPAIAQAVGLTFLGHGEPKQQLIDYIRNKEMLIVLDNFEHLLGGALLLTDLLRAAPGLKLLVTSRACLHVQCEHVLTLGGMEYPTRETDGLPDQYSAMVLFMHSARRTRPGFALTDETLPYVARICQLAQGMPLAILLAAAWTAALSPAEIAAQVEQSLDFLRADWQDEDRHASMRAVFDSAWRMLNNHEQTVFARLSVFRGGFTQEAAEQVAGAEPRTLTDLVNKSFVTLAQVDSFCEAGRYEIHELLRQYAQEKLDDRPDEVGRITQGRMAQYYLHYATAQRHEYARLGQEWPNLAAGLQIAVEQQMWSTVIGYVEAMTAVWFAWGRYAEAQQGYAWAGQAAQAVEDRPALAHCLHLLGRTHLEQDHFDEADRFLSQSLELYHALADRGGMADNQYDLARIALERSQYDRAKELLQSSRLLREGLGDPAGVAETLYQMARVAYFRADYDQTNQLGKQALEMQEKLADEHHISLTLRLLADTAYEQQDLAMAEAYCRRALMVSEKIQNSSEQALALDTLSHVYRALNQLESAQACSKKSLALLKSTGETRGQAMALYQLSLIYEAQGDCALALETGLQSLALCQELEYTVLIAIVLLHIGDYEVKLGRAEQAQQRWQQSLAIAESLPHPQLVKMLQQRFAQAAAA